MILSASISNPPLGAILTAEYLPAKESIKVEWKNDTCLNVSPNLTLDSNINISRFFARKCVPLLIEQTAIGMTEVDHWLSICIGPLSCTQEFNQTLNYIDSHLSTSTYLIRDILTIADLNLFGLLALNPTWVQCYAIGECPQNLLRWFNQIGDLTPVQSVLRNLPKEVQSKLYFYDCKGVTIKEWTTKDEGKFVELPGAEMGKVVVRFPPEASGYLHIGHAKAALLNWHYRELFQGTLVMRFDDTNPDKEKIAFEKVILEDLKLLEIFPDKFTHTSDHFPLLLSLCEKLLLSGQAYVDDTPADVMRQEREARKPSGCRQNTKEKNLEMWEDMKQGSDRGMQFCVRAKIDMSSDNGCMRDPTIYRCKNEPHPRTGSTYKVYPTYDFACPVVDSIEGVTHTLRTMEYHDRDDQYYWFIDALELRKPVIWEFARLNMMNTVLSKRKLTYFVENGIVESWEDPRFPTVRGVLRRGMTVQGLKQFIVAQGSSRSVVQMEWDKIWAFNKKVIDPIAPRYTGLEERHTIIVNIKGATPGKLTVPRHPKNSEVGNKTIWTGPRVLIEQCDAETLKEGQNATFINWGNVKILKIFRDNLGKITYVNAELNLTDTNYKKTVKLTWLAEQPQPFTPLELLYFDHIISKPVLAKDDDFKDFINYNSKKSIRYIGDPDLRALKTNEIIQLQRIGFFRVDKPASDSNPLVLIYIPDGSSKTPVSFNTTEDKKDSIIVAPEELKQIADVRLADREAFIGKSYMECDISSIHEQIVARSNIVRLLKADKAPKADIDEAVKALLDFKKTFKDRTGSEWTPVNSQEFDVNQLSQNILDQGNKVRQLKSDKAAKLEIDSAVKVLLDLKKAYKEQTGSEWTPINQQESAKPDVNILFQNIVDQGNKVRQLKSDKASKLEIDSAVKVLLDLKKAYKEQTGSEWTPVNQQESTKPDVHKLFQNIVDQGNKVRQLKSDKAAKLEIDSAVKVLLDLKKAYKEQTGIEWKPDASPPVEIKKEIMSPIKADDLSNLIVKQGNIVRDLKAAKTTKDVIDSEVKVLLKLKADFKTATGQDWQPPKVSSIFSTPSPPKKTDLSDAIIDQGNKVRELKSEKASKDIIDCEVKILLQLKTDYKAETGKDWQPETVKTPDSKTSQKSPAVKKSQEKKEKAGSAEKDEDKGMKKQTRLGLEAKKEENLPEWYSQVITKGELIEYYDVSGCYILRPWAFAVWEAIQKFLDDAIKELGVENAYFPMFVSRSVLEREKAHIADFAPEVAWVTKSGDSELAEHIAIRPTSETAMYPAYSKWIQSYRDLPLRLNQWNNVVRWEFKHPQPFLRTREFLWQEGHTAFATKKEAEEEVYQILDLYAQVYTDLLAVPVVKGRKTEKEKFAGGDFTTTVEAFVPASGRGIQGATSHHLGQNFSKMFDITVEHPDKISEKMFVYQNSWGLTTRTIGVMIMVHADNQGLVMPPRVAAIQIVIVPCGITASLPEASKVQLINACKKLEADLKKNKVRVKLDERDNYSPGWKFNHWELKGVPVRVELGPKDFEKSQLVAVRRDNGEKMSLSLADASTTLVQLLNSVQNSLLSRAEAELKAHMLSVTDWTTFCELLDAKNILLAPFCERVACEDNIKKDSARDQDLEPGAPAMGAKSLCIPFDQPRQLVESDKCIHPQCTAKPTRTKVNGKFLGDFSGKPVSMLAKVVKVHPNGMSLDMKTTDNHDVSIVLNQPLVDPVEGWVEVRGTGQGRCHILAQHLLTLPSNVMAKFDMEMFDDVVTVINSCSNPWVN